MPVTRADVARQAGVSPAVVSYVINGGPRPVATSTRMRVEAAIDALGYRPNALAGAFRRGSTKAVGLLIPSPRNPFYAEMAQVVETELTRHGYLMSIGISSFVMDHDTLSLRSFADRRMDGLIVAARASVTPELMGSIDLPSVILDDVADWTPPVNSVQTDNGYDVARTIAHLQHHGHTMIGCIAGPPHWKTNADRVQAWRDQQRRVGLPHDDGLLAHADISEPGGANALRSLLAHDSYRKSRHPQRPTAVFVSTDVQALGVLRACYELGIRVPDDLAIISFDGVNPARFTQPRLTTMRQPLQEIVSTAIGLILPTSSAAAAEPAQVTLRSNLVIGETCGCVPLPSA